MSGSSPVICEWFYVSASVRSDEWRTSIRPSGCASTRPALRRPTGPLGLHSSVQKFR